MEPLGQNNERDESPAYAIDHSPLPHCSPSPSQQSPFLDRYAIAFRCASDAILFITPQLQAIEWNPPAERLFKLTPESLGTDQWLWKVAKDDIPQLKGMIEEASIHRPGAQSNHWEMQLRSTDDSKFDGRVRVYPIDNDESSTLLLIVSDLSQLKLAEQETKEAIRGRDQFLAMLSHELRNPLSAILNAYEILKSPASGKAATEEARHVAEGQLKHLTRLLDDLLDVSRVVNHRLSLKMAKADMKTIISEAIESVRHQFTEKGQRLVINLPPYSLPVHADPSRLHQAHVNLLVNASKYSPSGSIIQVIAETVDDHAICHIIDSGAGVPEGLRERIFEPFVQIDRTLDRSEGGMGIGLALVKLIVETHQGSIQVRNNLSGSGSCFTLALPQSPSENAEASNKDEADFTPCKVLLIEDMADVRLMMVRALQLCGFEVLWAETGLSGIELLKNSAVDAVIVDIGLPDISGYEVARRIRQTPELTDAFLIAVTGYGMPEDVDSALEAGFNLHMLKPIHFPELVRVLERVHAGAAD